MSVEHIEFLVEEYSMEVFLSILLPRIWSDLSFRVHSFQGKRALLGRLGQRLAGYGQIPASQRIIVLIDRDDEDCLTLKRRLEEAAHQTGLSTPSQGEHQGSVQVINRIVIEELEAWYLGDWEAMKQAYPGLPERVPPRFRDPESVKGAWESFERVLQKAGHFDTRLSKVEIARTLAPHMDLARNRSHSFRVFVETIETLRESRDREA